MDKSKDSCGYYLCNFTFVDIGHVIPGPAE